MFRSVRIHEFGDASVLHIEDADVGEPDSGEARSTVVPPFDIFGRDLAVRGFALTASTRDDAKLTALKKFVSLDLADGAFHPTIARTFPFERIADAHRYMEAGEHVGKIVVTL